jgi:hypothetical protein
MMLHPEIQSISPLSDGTTLIKKAQGLSLVVLSVISKNSQSFL